MTAPSAAVMTRTTGSAARSGTPATDSLAKSTLPTASVEAREMSISPWTTIGNRPKAISAKITKNWAELSRFTGLRKYGDRVLDHRAASTMRTTSSSSVP